MGIKTVKFSITSECPDKKGPEIKTELRALWWARLESNQRCFYVTVLQTAAIASYAY